jgi:hypothetical protein
MGTRFQKRVKILPGVTLNFSKSGVSTSLGVRGARMTVGNGKTRTTVGLPGTGLSHTTIEKTGEQTVATQLTTKQHFFAQLVKAIFNVVILVFSLFSVIMTTMAKSPKKRGRSRY